MIKISIIMPVYNSEKTVSKSIISILEQSFKEFELVIVNDGSIDNTRCVCERFLSDNRIKLININNSGPSKARNIALDNCVGKYVMFIDSDDYYDKEMLKVMYNSIENNDSDMVCCNYIEVHNGISKYTKPVEQLNCKNKKDLYQMIDFLKKEKKLNMIWNKIYKREVLNKNKIRFDTNIEMGEDYKFNIDYFNIIENVNVINDYLYNYVFNIDSLCGKYRKDDFYIKLNNLQYHENMYIKNNYPLKNIYKYYLMVVMSSINTLFSNKCPMGYYDKISKIREYITNDKINEIIKCNFTKNLEQKIFYILIKYRLCRLIYIYTKARINLKKAIYKIKKQNYR